MKHPVRDRVLILLCALCALCDAACLMAVGIGRLSLDPIVPLLEKAALMGTKTRVILVIVSVVLLLFAVLLIGITLPGKKKRSSTYAIQRNENGMVRISLKALETLVQKCLNQHAELKVVTSSLFSDEESIRVDVHITLQSDISMPLAISALQKQIKKYLEACSGVMVQEVRVFVDGTTPATEETAQSPYAIPTALLGIDTEALPSGRAEAAEAAPAQPEAPAAPVQEASAVEPEEAAPSPEEAEPAAETQQETEEDDAAKTGDWA